jgi:aconitate hydratase
MGVLPCQFKDGADAASLKLDGTETFDLLGLEKNLGPRQDARLVIRRASGGTQDVAVTVRIDTPIEVEYFRHGGILPYVLRQILGRA